MHKSTFPLTLKSKRHAVWYRGMAFAGSAEQVTGEELLATAQQRRLLGARR